MKNLTLENITKACGGSLYYADGADMEAEARGVAIDSRLMQEGYVFVAINGAKVDGHSFIKEVLENGAMAAICEKLPDNPGGPCILVDNSVEALQALARYYRDQVDVKVVGITGSVGKTSTKEVVAGVLSKKYCTYKTEGNLNNTIGVPLTILRIRDNMDIAVVEMGINQFGEMSLLTGVAKPDIAIITNIGTCHLEYLNDRDGVLRAKTEIFEGLNQDGLVILCHDDDKLATVESVNGKRPVFYGIDNEDSDYIATNIVYHELEGSDFEVVCKDKSRFSASILLPGKHMVSNALVAVAVAKHFGMTTNEIVDGLADVHSIAGRNNVINLSNITIIDDCYNANPTSTMASIDTLQSISGSRVAVLGDMFELGKNEAKLHFDLGSYVAMHMIDKIVCIGKLSKNTYEGAMKAKAACVYYFETVEEALPELLNIITKNDTVLCKASNGMNFKEIVNFLKEKDEEI